MNGRETPSKAPGGWFVSNPSSSKEPLRKRCPTCAQEIHVVSKICPVCDHILQRQEDDSSLPASRPARTSRKAVASLILGCFSCLIVPGIAAAALGHISQSEIRRSQGQLKGRGIALAGLVLGYFGLAITALILTAFGIPNRVRLWMTGTDNQPGQALRLLNIANQTYAATYERGFPEELAQLGPPASTSSLNANAAGFVESGLIQGQAFGYKFTYLVTARDSNGFPIAYTIRADPLDPIAGSVSHFFTDQTQAIRVEQGHPATSASPPVEEP